MNRKLDIILLQFNNRTVAIPIQYVKLFVLNHINDNILFKRQGYYSL